MDGAPFRDFFRLLKIVVPVFACIIFACGVWAAPYLHRLWTWFWR